MRRGLAIGLALVLTVALFGCAARQEAVQTVPPAADAAAGSEAGPTSAQAPEKEAWDYEVVMETAAEEKKADDGTVLAAWQFERPVLRMKSTSGKTFDGHLPNLGVTAEQIAICKAFNDEVAAYEMASLEEFDSFRKEGSEQYAWKAQQGIDFLTLTDQLTVESVFHSGDLLSIRAAEYVNMGGAHPDWSYVVWNFDLGEGAFVTPMSLTGRPEALRRVIADEIVNQIYASEAYEGYFQDFEETVRAKTDFDAFFDENGMTVLFTEYEIAPHALGVPEFTIGRDRLVSYLNERGERLLAPSSEDRAVGDFYEANDMWYWFEGGMPFDNTDTKEFSDMTYYRVDVPGVTSIADLRAQMQTRFSDDVVQQRLVNSMGGMYPLLREVDGVAYVIPAGRGTDMYIDSVSCRAELDANGKSGRIIATIQWRDYDEEKEEWVLKDTSDTAMPFVLGEDGHARFTDFRTIW